MARPVRLREVSYIGPGAYFVTTCTRDRVRVFDDHVFGNVVAHALLAHAAENEFGICAYCVMPDHVHFVPVAKGDRASLCDFVKRWKQATGIEWSRRGHGKLWQVGYWERVLRDDEAMLSVARYVIENPVRARLVDDPAQYPLLGSSEYSVEQILEALQMNWGRRWRRT